MDWNETTMIFLGGLVGLVIGFWILSTLPVGATVIASLLALVFAPLLPLLTTLVTIIAPVAVVLPTLPLTSWALVAGLAFALMYIFSYLIASISLAPAIAAAGAASVPTNLAENFMRGLMIGLTSALNAGIWSLLGFPSLGLLLGLIGFLAVFPFISRNGIYQGLLGWTGWIMPMSYLATTLGFILFVLNLPFAIAAGGIGAIRFDVLTATIESAGGLVAVSPSPGFNLGNFSFLVSVASQTPFGSPGLSAHETGHTLTVAAFSGVFHWIDAVDENVLPFAKRARAYGELISESHIPSGTFPWLGVWSP